MTTSARNNETYIFHVSSKYKDNISAYKFIKDTVESF